MLAVTTVMVMVFSVSVSSCTGKEKAVQVSQTENVSFHNQLEVIRVIDGDTFVVTVHSIPELFGKYLGVRVRGVNTPELRSKNECEKKKAKSAKKFVEGFLVGGALSIHNCDRGKYFRIVCSVTKNGVDLSEELIKNKLAVPYDGGTKPKVDWCKM